MTPSESPPDPRRPRATLALVAGLFATALVGAGGCSKPPTTVVPPDEPSARKGDPWQTAGQRLKKDTDWGGVRLALAGLAGDLNAQNKDPLPALSDADLAALGALVPLTPADREEVRAATFTPYDSVYVADCLYLRDAARSLALTGVPPEAQAELAFAWVCRQVYLNPWQLADRPEGATALPPTAVLRRGSGSGLERMYVFLALLQQLELDGCLVGPPGAATQPAGFPVLTADKTAFATGAPRGPFWAVGVRLGTDVKLFDPWRGVPFPVTLGQLRANPDAAQAWFADPANISGTTLDEIKRDRPTAFLAVPVNALAPRMAAVDAKLKADLGVRLSYQAAALRDAFPDPKPAFWNPPDEPAVPGALAYGRAARALLPFDAGGTDRGPPGGRLYDIFRREQLPTAVFRAPDALVPTLARARLGATAAGALGVSFIEPPNPRERIQRGQFQDAAKDLVTKQDAFSSGLERLRLNKDADQQIREWIDAVNGLYQELKRAELNENKEDAANLTGQIESQWRMPGALYLVDRASSEVGLAEATLLLALCKHEVAERAQVRADRATGPGAAVLRQNASDLWRTALSAWRTYEQYSGAHAGFPGRSAHAQALAARAEQLANVPPPKK